jgi:amino acid adenylation domain-containing protein/thioester reductase-like protein
VDFEGRTVFSLSQSQWNIWNLEQAYPGTSINYISTTVSIRGKIDFVLLQRSICMLLEADATLRTRITLQGEKPVQYFAPYQEQNFDIYDFTHTDQEGISSWETAMSREVIPILDAPLYRFALFCTGENAGGFFVKLHHLISDGWSQMLVCNRIGRTYLALLAGEEPDTGEIPAYDRHLQEEEEYLAGKARRKDEQYWKEQVEKAGEPSVIKSIKSAAVSPVGRRLSFRLPQVLNHAIYLYCLKNRVAPFAVFYMALAIYFRRIGGAARFTVGVPIFNRSSYLMKQCTGMFVNTLPFYNEIQDEWSLDRFNEELMDAWYELLRHQRYPFSHIVRLADRGGREDGRLFHIALSYQDSVVYENRDACVVFDGRWHYSGYQAEQLCIHLSNMESHKQYCVDYDYLSQFFAEEEIARLHENLVNILMEALHNPDKPLCRLSVLGREEREKVLYTFNSTGQYLEETGLYQVFEQVVREYPQRAAAICRGNRLTYSQLSDWACAVSEGLEPFFGEEKGVAAILLPRQFALLAAMLGTLRSGNAYLLLSAQLPVKRILAVCRKSGAGVLLTDEEMAGRLRREGADIRMLFPEQLTGSGTGKEAARTKPEALAYVVYTSGSTGEPKGVEITRRSLLNLVKAMTPIYGKGAVLSVCNVGFDAFTLESTAALLNGRTVILPQEEEQESPRRLAELINGYAAGFLSITPSRLTAFLKDPAFSRAMRRMESIVCGGEAFTGELLKLLRNSTNARIYNQYGPSETTVAVSMKELGDASAITVGKPMPNCRMYVLDPWMNPQPVGVYGQLYIGGVCVGRGYRNAPKLTEQSFLENPFEAGERIYATGDVARWTAEGEIVLAGRLDRQVKLRGLRIEPQEVADCIASYPGVEEAAARVCPLNGQMVLTAYYCAQKEIPEMELLAFSASYLPQYMIPSFVIRLDRLPLTPSGKVDEEKLPLPAEEKACLSAASEDALTGRILEIFRAVLEKEEMGADSDYFLCGGNSLNAMEVLAQLEDHTGKLLRISDLYACRTAGRLARYIGGEQKLQEETHTQELRPAPKLERYPLTPVQQGIYVQSCMDSQGFAYHMAGAFRIRGAVDRERLEDAFRKVIAGDGIFRTAFVQEEDGVFARISGAVPFSLPLLRGESLEEAAGQICRPFCLAEAPLLRAGLWQDMQGAWYLIIDVHHIIADGMSTPLLAKRLSRYYRGAAQEYEKLGYQDYAYALSLRPEKGKERDRQYWKAHLSPLPEPLLLPADKPRPKNFDFRGKNHTHRINAEITERCNRWCRENGISPYMLFLGAYGILLSAVSGKKELLVGTPAAGRNHRQLQEICGPFINTMPLRLRIDRDARILPYLQEVRQEVTGMLEHPDCSLEEMIAMLGLPRSFSDNPLYQAAFSMRPFETGKLALGETPMEYVPVFTGTAKTELFMELVQEEGEFRLQFEYASSLFEDETIRLYARSLETIARGLVEGEAETIGELSVLDAGDQMERIEIPNYRFMPYLNQPVHQMIRNRARLYPGETAVIYHGKKLTCRMLEQMAGGVAYRLHEAGAARGDRIGLCTARTPWLLAGMLGILKAGCAYVPLGASLPEKRVRYILETAGAAMVLCDEENRENMQQKTALPLLPVKGTETGAWEDTGINGEDLIHVLFTSGSTGRPKGVMLRHRSLSNLFANMKMRMAAVTGPVLCTANMMFDIFIVESLFPLALGNPVVMADEEEMMLPWKLAGLIRDTGAEFMQMTASRLQMCLGNETFRQAAAGLKLVIAGGEPLTETLAADFRQVCQGTLLNMYGPTEAAVCTTAEEVVPGRRITIGCPLSNCRVYVLDGERRPVIPTAAGELYLAGEGIAEGYIGRPELTEERFFPDIYFPEQRMYQSGDIGRLRADGRIEFLGRRDDQVKINGQRVELDEIVNSILESGAASQAAVVPVKKPDGSTELIAYYVSRDGGDREEEIRTWLRSCLTEVMVPGRFCRLDRLPVTPNGKVDLLLLKKNRDKEEDRPETKAAAFRMPDPDPVKNTGVTSGPEPGFCPSGKEQKKAGNGLEDKLLRIWSAVLGKEDLSPGISFFEQGGTSLGALSVLSRYFNEGMEMTMARFYENPTARAQAAILAGAGPENRKEEAPTYPAKVPPARPVLTEEKNVLLTGATGFFGAHLLKELLARPGVRVICLVRGGDKKRLEDTLSWYFGAGWIAGVRSRIQTADGDLALPRLGMEEKQWKALAEEIDGIYHSAADVRHYAADAGEFLTTNVTGTETMIGLALQADAMLHYISTASISGDFLVGEPEKTAVFTEADFYIGQNWEDNIYIRSKFLAEAEVYRAMEEKGLHARVYRLGRITGRCTDQVFQRNPENNAAFLLMRAVRCAGAITESMARLPVDLTPVDWCASAVLALGKSRRTAFHLLNPLPPSMKEVALAMVPGLLIVPDSSYGPLLLARMTDANRDILAPLLDYHNRTGAGESRIRVDCTVTLEAFKEEGFTWAIPPAAHLTEGFSGLFS